MELTISIIGASVAVMVSLIGAWLTNRNSITLQTRKLKEQYYIDYVLALHYGVTNGFQKNWDTVNLDYVKARHILFTVASSDVVSKIFEFEKRENWNGEKLTMCLTSLMKAIRKDLKVSNKNLPDIIFLSMNR